YMDQYQIILSESEVNEISRNVFLISDNRKTLMRALKLSKRSIANYPNVKMASVDTYANLLYKTGDRENGMIWEKKALKAIDPDAGDRIKEYETTLSKMQKGEKTWPDSGFPVN